jgi:hypothetical protein
MASGVNMLITLENNQLFSKSGNQSAIPIFPESQTLFFAKVVDAELEFAKDDDQGRPSQLILHQNGRDMPAKRLDDAESQRIADAAAAFSKRFKDQMPPGSEAALRKMIEELRLGKPNYCLMSPGLAAARRQQRAALTLIRSNLRRAHWSTGSGSGRMEKSRAPTSALNSRLLNRPVS